jgi:hypothetical protein
MFIKLTNANTQNTGMPVVLNSDMIVSINRAVMTNEDGTIEEKTILFVPPHGNWEVKETLDEVLLAINSAQ